MNLEISSSVWNALMCPNCGEALRKSEQSIVCSSCDSSYEYTKSGSIDLRLQQKKMFQHEFELGTPLQRQSGVNFGLLPLNSAPEVDYSGIDVPFHLTKELLSHIPKAKSDNCLILDLGCGNAIHQKIAEHAGYKYIGLDYENEKAPMLGDGHSLPLKDESVDFIISIAVLEHIRFPFVMMKEAHRVLKPKGTFIGTVAFLEPFHGDSYYHHTHLGTYNSLQEGGFTIMHICPSEKWSVLAAQRDMGLFPRMPSLLSKLIILPVEIIHKIWWRIGGYISGKSLEETRITKTTGSFTFIAQK